MTAATFHTAHLPATLSSLLRASRQWLSKRADDTPPTKNDQMAELVMKSMA